MHIPVDKKKYITVTYVVTLVDSSIRGRTQE